MKEFLKKYPFLSSLILSGIVVIITFAVSRFDHAEWFLGRTVSASGSADAAEDHGGSLEEPAEEDASDAEKEEHSWKDLVIGMEDEKPDIQDEEPEQEASSEETENDPSDAVAGEEEDISGDEEEDPAGITEFIYYEPVKVNSRYYEDPGKRPLTTTYPYSTVERDYFDDAVFIGDSRMVGLYDYAGFGGADFFCDNGFCVYTWEKKGEVKFQNEHKKVNLMDALAEKQYRKVYLMIGMNDCGYGNNDTFRQGLEKMIAEIAERQPEAIFYLMANMYIAQEKEDEVFNNIDINSKNVILAECADGKKSFYLEYNDLYQDENGCLDSKLTFDGVHLYGKHYTPWVDFLLSHAVVRGE